jgi:hypothetical protein
MSTDIFKTTESTTEGTTESTTEGKVDFHSLMTGQIYQIFDLRYNSTSLIPGHSYITDEKTAVITATGEITRYARIEELEQLKQEVSSLKEQISRLQLSLAQVCSELTHCTKPHIRQKEMI